MQQIQVYHDAGRWIVECPRCKWAIRVPRDFTDFRCGRLPPGQVYANGLGEFIGEGGGCGYQAAVQWPEDADAIEKLLAQRLRRDQRNWHPREGDTVAQLRIENAVLGVPSGLET